MRRMELAPGEPPGGDVSEELCIASAEKATIAPMTGCGARTAKRTCSGAKGTSGIMAASSECVRQQGAFISAPCIGQSCAIPVQHACGDAAGPVSRHALSGKADQNTAMISNNSAPFVLRWMLGLPMVISLSVISTPRLTVIWVTMPGRKRCGEFRPRLVPCFP